MAAAPPWLCLKRKAELSSQEGLKPFSRATSLRLLSGTSPVGCQQQPRHGKKYTGGRLVSSQRGGRGRQRARHRGSSMGRHTNDTQLRGEGMQTPQVCTKPAPISSALSVQLGQSSQRDRARLQRKEEARSRAGGGIGPLPSGTLVPPAAVHSGFRV